MRRQLLWTAGTGVDVAWDLKFINHVDEAVEIAVCKGNQIPDAFCNSVDFLSAALHSGVDVVVASGKPLAVRQLGLARDHAVMDY